MNMKATQSTLAPGGKEKKLLDTRKKIKKGGYEWYYTDARDYEDIIYDVEAKHGRKNFYALFSGGKDSMTAAHKLYEMGKLKSIIHIKTYVGLQMTEDYVRDVCREYNWPLKIISPTTKYIYAARVLENGFPVNSNHRIIMGYLKYKAMYNFGATDPDHCFVSGIRKMESTRRSKNYLTPIQRNGFLWHCNPIFYYSGEETYRYIHEHGLRISPAYQTPLKVSGDCLCGSYASHNDKVALRLVDPKLADYIEWLEEGVEKFGTPAAKKYGKWGGRVKMSELEQQQQLDSFLKQNPALSEVVEMESQVCGTECGPGTLRGLIDY